VRQNPVESIVIEQAGLCGLYRLSPAGAGLTLVPHRCHRHPKLKPADERHAIRVHLRASAVPKLTPTFLTNPLTNPLSHPEDSA
jgi:hypothetical protein